VLAILETLPTGHLCQLHPEQKQRCNNIITQKNKIINPLFQIIVANNHDSYKGIYQYKNRYVIVDMAGWI
jgi:hypothetical protein